jgi:DNA-directed RNA polymerase specialized sigma24 family protein
LRLAAIDPRLRTVVEMKVFEGLTGVEIARRLGCSRGTVSNCWSFAQCWLQDEWARPGAAEPAP